MTGFFAVSIITSMYIIIDAVHINIAPKKLIKIISANPNANFPQSSRAVYSHAHILNITASTTAVGLLFPQILFLSLLYNVSFFPTCITFGLLCRRYAVFFSRNGTHYLASQPSLYPRIIAFLVLPTDVPLP